MKTMTIDSDVMDILRGSSIKGNTLRLPQGQLAPDKYQRVAKVIGAAGGKWNRSLGCHVFPAPPHEIFSSAFESGSIVNLKQERQSFFTPKLIARRMIQKHAYLKPGEWMLEPSAGKGSIAVAAVELGVIVRCIEKEQSFVDELQCLDLHAMCLDFLALKPKRNFEAVVMNPPFANGADIDHVTHAFKFLKPGGRLVSIMSHAITFRETRKFVKFRAWMDENCGAIAEFLPSGTFKESGTNMKAVIITARNLGKEVCTDG